MNTKAFDDDGRIIAFSEYRIVDKEGKDTKDGEYCFVCDLWVHPTYRSNSSFEAIKSIVQLEHTKFPSVKWIYYGRGKYNERIRMYPITLFYKER